MTRKPLEMDLPFDRQPQHKKAVDYFTPLGKHMIAKNVYNRRRRRANPRGQVRPEELFVTDLPAPTTFNTATEDIPRRFVHVSTNKSKHAIYAVKWTPDARRVVVSSYSGEFTIWNGFTFNFESIMQAHDFPIFSLEYSHNGKWLISGDQAGTIKYWQPNFNNVNILGKAHDNSVGELKFSPGDAKFVSCSDDQTLKIWDFATAKEERVLKGHHWDVKSCDWHSSLGLVISGSKDNLVKLWDPRDSTCVTTLHDFKHTVNKTVFQKSGNERLFAACSRDHSTRVFDLRMLRCINVIKSENEADLTALSWHPVHSTTLTVGAYDGSVSHYNTSKTVDIESFQAIEAGAFMKRHTPITTEASHSVPFAHEKAVHAIEYHPLGHMLCTAGADKSMRFWCRGKPADIASLKDVYHTGEENIEENKIVKTEEENGVSIPGLSIPGLG